MPKNTGRGTRAACDATEQSRDNPRNGALWRRNVISGRFTESKRTGGAFKGIRRTG